MICLCLCVRLKIRARRREVQNEVVRETKVREWGTARRVRGREKERKPRESGGKRREGGRMVREANGRGDKRAAPRGGEPRYRDHRKRARGHVLLITITNSGPRFYTELYLILFLLLSFSPSLCLSLVFSRMLSREQLRRRVVHELSGKTSVRLLPAEATAAATTSESNPRKYNLTETDACTSRVLPRPFCILASLSRI